MSRKMIFDITTLSFNRPCDGYLDDNNNWVSSPVENIQATGDLQPYIPMKGQFQIEELSGFKTSDAKVFVSDADLRAIDDYNLKLADYTEIKGRTYFVYKKFDFNDNIISTDTNFYILVMQKMKAS